MSIRRAVVAGTAVAAAGASALLGLPAAQAAALPGVVISAIYFDSPGSDNGSNASLNAEWVHLYNRTHASISMTGWTLRDAANHTFRFPSYSIGAGRYVTVHTGVGTAGGGNFYQNSHWYIWNNTGDTASLRHANGAWIDGCTYTAKSDPMARC